MLRAFLDWSTKVLLPLGGWGLFLVAFAESSFFPLPPDVLLIPLALASPKLALWYATLCTVSSVAGGVFGYFIGKRAGRRILLKLTTADRIAGVERLFERWGGWAVGVAAFTPIPYKVFTIAAGLFQVDGSEFLLASVIGRGGRFFLEAILIARYGRPMVAFISRNFELLTVGITIAVALGYWLYAAVRGRSRETAGHVSIADRVSQSARVLVDRRLAIWGEHAVYFAAGWVAFSLAVVGLGKIVNEVFLEKEPVWEDLTLLRLVHTWVNPHLTKVMIAITTLASVEFVAVAALLVTVALLIKRRYVEATTTVIAVAGSGVLVELLKLVFHRPRPTLFPHLVVETDFGFPSGHAMIALTFYGLMAYFLFRSKSVGLKSLTTLLAGVIGLVGVSRVYLGVHWPTDILGGYVTGGAWLLACVLVSEELRIRLRP